MPDSATPFWAEGLLSALPATVSFVTVFPTWAVWLLSIGSPVVTAAVVMVGVYFTRKSARETTQIAADTARQLEVRSQREEDLTQLRWAAELAASTIPTPRKPASTSCTQSTGQGCWMTPHSCTSTGPEQCRQVAAAAGHRRWRRCRGDRGRSA